MLRDQKRKLAGWALLIGLLLLWRQFGPGLPLPVVYSHDEIADAFAKHRTGFMIDINTRVSRLLPGTGDADPQQRFTVELDNRHVLLIEHDLDHAPPLPLSKYDLVRIRGEYEWTAQGGVVRSTYRDPYFGLKHGWIDHKGERYD